ncbi:MAG: hypothetical protein GTO63_28545 [Anaerolineae bacterium]|nr:hypothetical protein [Anaerolineae bacterium]
MARGPGQLTIEGPRALQPAAPLRWNRKARVAASLATGMVFLALWASFVSIAVPVSITIPFSSVPVADSDLDGDPATGDWSDALNVTIPLENGELDPYGTATLYVKHDGTNLYFRIDGFMDVFWVSTAGDHFWLGFVASPTDTDHHGGGEWDGTFFGHSDYGAQPVAIDTNGFDRPPTEDVSQDVTGFMASSGVALPYPFTAEWKRPLSSGDADDLVYVADGTTTYNFFVTTDSDGGGSSGGGISHSGSTNLNTFKIAPAVATDEPPTIEHIAPVRADVGEEITLVASVSDDKEAPAFVRVNYTGVMGETVNATMSQSGSLYTYVIPPQNESGILEYLLWAADTSGNEVRTPTYTVSVFKILEAPSLMAVVASDPGCLRLTWETTAAADLAWYRLYRWNASRSAMEPVAEMPADAASYLDCSLEYDTVYTYWLTALNQLGYESPPSALGSGRTTAPVRDQPDLLPYHVAAAVLVAVALVLSIVVVMRRKPPENNGKKAS